MVARNWALEWINCEIIKDLVAIESTSESMLVTNKIEKWRIGKAT